MPEWFDSQWVGNVAAVGVGAGLAWGADTVRWLYGRNGRKAAESAAKRERRYLELRYYVEMQLLATNALVAFRRLGYSGPEPSGLGAAVAHSGTWFRATMLAEDEELKRLIDQHRRASSALGRTEATNSASVDALATELLAVELLINQRMVDLGIVG
jgi:hypothetical protein